VVGARVGDTDRLLAAGWVFLRIVGQSRDWMPNFFFAAPILIGLYYLLKTVFPFSRRVSPRRGESASVIRPAPARQSGLVMHGVAGIPVHITHSPPACCP
jgi:hypothetical protein